MENRTKRAVAGLLAGVALAGCGAGPAVASAAPSAETAAAGQVSPGGYVLDGFEIICLPDGLGANVSNFEYEFEGVAFKTQVWETGPDEQGAYQTDLNVMVLRGERLRDVQALRDYLTFYQERDPREWHLDRIRHHGHPGYLGDDQAFWLVRPGLGVLVKVYGERFDQRDVITVAGGVREAR